LQGRRKTLLSFEKMKTYFWIVLLAVIPYTTISAGSGMKPQWKTRGENYLNNQIQNKSYEFKIAHSHGNSPSEAREGKIKALAGHFSNSDTYRVEESLESENVQGKTAHSSVTYREKVTNQQITKTFYHVEIDEYWECTDGVYHLYTLYATSKGDQEPVFDCFSTTTSYGTAPALMSIIPGVGQFYKGSIVKGICMFAGVAACGLGALFCENERSSYKNKMKEQPQFAQTYNTKANNYETARNICLGAAAAIWVYNIIDAATAKGAKKIVISPNHDSYLSIHPVATSKSFSISFAYNF